MAKHDDDEMLDDLCFERKIKEMKDRELLEFIGRQTFAMTKTCTLHASRLSVLENQRGPSAKFIAAIGAGVGGAVAGLVYGLIVLIKDHVI